MRQQPATLALSIHITTAVNDTFSFHYTASPPQTSLPRPYAREPHPSFPLPAFDPKVIHHQPTPRPEPTNPHHPHYNNKSSPPPPPSRAPETSAQQSFLLHPRSEHNDASTHRTPSSISPSVDSPEKTASVRKGLYAIVRSGDSGFEVAQDRSLITKGKEVVSWWLVESTLDGWVERIRCFCYGSLVFDDGLSLVQCLEAVRMLYDRESYLVHFLWNFTCLPVVGGAYEGL